MASCRVAGWATADHLRTDLVAQALDNAVRHRRPEPGVIFHADRGCQYTSRRFGALARTARWVRSVLAYRSWTPAGRLSHPPFAACATTSRLTTSVRRSPTEIRILLGTTGDRNRHRGRLGA
ncbi:DDE-type integrase/transposase/recombinase [Saccharothrix saharensis]|uniref:DDE-type integrase/transposase/recombinase n=1 Tax=Saccharothrix saharensis TaxID=571190 RepID=UPI003CCC4C79